VPVAFYDVFVLQYQN